MSKVENNRKIIETYYKSIASGDFETVMSLMHEDVVFNIVGETPYAGKWEGRDNIYGILVPAVVSNFKEGSVKFAERWNAPWLNLILSNVMLKLASSVKNPEK